MIALMSAIVFAGSSQFIAVSMIGSGAGVVSIITTFFVNLRHVLMSSALALHLKGRSRWLLSLYAYGVTDEWLSGREVNHLFVRWLRFVPACILSALVLPSVLMNPATQEISLSRPEFLVALPTLAFGWWSRSLGGTVIVGMLLFFLAGKLL